MISLAKTPSLHLDTKKGKTTLGGAWGFKSLRAGAESRVRVSRTKIAVIGKFTNLFPPTTSYQMVFYFGKKDLTRKITSQGSHYVKQLKPLPLSSCWNGMNDELDYP